MRVRDTVVLVLALSAAHGASACSIAGSKEVSFAGESRALEASQVLSVTNWYVGLRDGHIGIANISVYARSIKGNAAHADLVNARVAAVTDLVRTLRANDSIPLRSEVAEGESPGPEQYPEVVVSIQPECAATRTCCSELIQK